MPKKLVVMGLSGGMDSSTLLSWFLAQGWEVHCCIFSYGSKHNSHENRAAYSVADYYLAKGEAVRLYRFELDSIMGKFNSNLLLSGGEIPEGHQNDESMKKTVVPGRNLIFASIMAGLAESIGAGIVALGVHAGDHFIYPDCRPEFIQALNETVIRSSDERVIVTAPFSNIDKQGILKIGFDLGTPYNLTRTCYKDQEVACGKCGSCRERLEAFELLGVKDPIQYA
jgi:7-cyano-7-deazaguanine synthase